MEMKYSDDDLNRAKAIMGALPRFRVADWTWPLVASLGIVLALLTDGASTSSVIVAGIWPVALYFTGFMDAKTRVRESAALALLGEIEPK